MDDIGFVKTILNLTCFDIMNRFCNVHSYSSGFRVWHKTFWSKYTTKTSYNAHHVRCSNNDVEIKPSFVLDLRNKVLSSYEFCACSFCFLSFCISCKYKNTNLFTGSVRQNNSSTNLLICMTSIAACTDVSFDSLVKFSNCCFFYKADSLCGII